MTNRLFYRTPLEHSVVGSWKIYKAGIAMGVRSIKSGVREKWEKNDKFQHPRKLTEEN